MPRYPTVFLLVAAGCSESPDGGPSFGNDTTQPSTSTIGPASDGGDVTSGGGGSGGVKLDVLPPGPGELPPACDELADLEPTSVGCRFYAIDTPVHQPMRPFGVSVGNPWGQVAHVRIEDLRGPGLREIATVAVEPRSSELLKLNGDRGILDLEDHTVDESGLNPAAAFRITSDVPITAMQINPVGGGPSAEPDASLLLPVNALDSAYIALGYQAASIGWHGWITVVSVEDGTSLQTPQGPVVLDEFDAWHIPFVRTMADAGDPTGVRIDADRPVAAFAGSLCAFVPPEASHCDHLEEQLFPLSTWGTTYVGARHPRRLPAATPTPEPVHWRVVAAVPNTQVHLDPPVAGIGGQIDLVSAGSWAELSTADSFVATGNNPFMLVQYMGGCTMVIPDDAASCYHNYDASGDPSMVQTVPVEQWLTQAPFVTDTSYPRDFVVIARPAGASVSLDCLGPVPDDHFLPIPGTGYEVGHVELDLRDRTGPELDPGFGGEGDCRDGQQYITATEPLGLFVGGVDFAASYAYPVGMGFVPTWTPPPAG